MVREKYIAKLCHDINDMKTMHFWDNSFLADQMQSVSFDSVDDIVMSKSFESNTEIDFTEDEVLITTQSNTSATTFDFEIISFENCTQNTVKGCIAFHHGSVDFLQFSKGKYN